MNEPVHLAAAPRRRWLGADRAIAAALALGAVVALGIAQRQVGIPRDEGIYFEAAERYWGWFGELGDNLRAGRPLRSFTVGAIARHWNFNTEHPALFKTLFAFSWRLLHRGLGWLSEMSAFRFPGWCLTGLGVALVYLLGARLVGRVAGLAGALLYLTTPHVFFHGQLACFDSGVTTLTLLVVYGYVRGLDSPRWAIATGVFFGLAVAGKHNAWFVAPVLLLHYLFVARGDWLPGRGRRLRWPRLPLVFPAMALLGPLVFYLHWPWLWFDTVAHLRGYLDFHLNYAIYNVEYLGRNWNRKPLPVSYPFGMTLLTVPVVMQALALAGAWLRLAAWWRGRGGAATPSTDAGSRPAAPGRSWLRPGAGLDPCAGLLFAACALYPLVLIALPSTPISGGTKHFMSGWAFLALLAGVAVQALARALERAGALRLVARALPGLVALPGALYLGLTHPYALSQYNVLAGGQAGAADLGMQRQFWGYSPRGLLPWMNAHVEPGARVYFHDVIGYAHRAYQRAGLLRPDIAYAGIERPAIEASSHALVVHERHFDKYEYWIWDAYGSAAPEQVLTLGGVPLVTLYGRPPLVSPEHRRDPAATQGPHADDSPAGRSDEPSR